jgi:hypothetical protein
MLNKSDIQTATPESVWAALQETDRVLSEKFAETREQFKETERLIAQMGIDFDRRLEASRAEFDQQLKASRADYERRMKKYDDTMGAWSNNQGAFAEEYFFNSFENGKQDFFGERFDEIEKNVKGLKKGFKDEYDILLINGKTIGIVEVKYKAHQNDVPKVLKKAETFRVNFPEYARHNIYLGLATLVFYPELEQDCINEGIAIVKQVGDTVVINDKHLKVF